jgi:Uma2 family endonuclease
LVKICAVTVAMPVRGWRGLGKWAHGKADGSAAVWRHCGPGAFALLRGRPNRPSSHAMAPSTLLEPSPRAARVPVGEPLLSSEQFLDWLEPGIRADLVGGKIRMHSPVNLRHARLLNFLERLMAAHIEDHDLGELHRENVAVRLSARDTFMPDLAYFPKEQIARMAPSHVPFAPTFAVEAVSPSSEQRDRSEKFSRYELHGVQEYWILDPEKLAHRLYRRSGEMFTEFAAGAARIDSFSLPGFWVKRAWLDPERLPAVRTCLAEIGGAKARRRA